MKIECEEVIPIMFGLFIVIIIIAFLVTSCEEKTIEKATSLKELKYYKAKNDPD